MSIDQVLLVAALAFFIAAACGWGKGVPVGLACWVATQIF